MTNPLTLAPGEDEREIETLVRHLAEPGATRSLHILDGMGHELTLPESVVSVLTRVVNELAEGSAVTVVATHAMVTSQQAADFLQVSRPHLIKLLDEKQIPYEKVGTHRRIRFADLVEYRRERSERRRRVLDTMIAESSDLGLQD